MDVPDNATVADLGDEPEGFWKPVHDQVAGWLVKYGDGPDESG